MHVHVGIYYVSVHLCLSGSEMTYYSLTGCHVSMFTCTVYFKEHIYVSKNAAQLSTDLHFTSPDSPFDKLELNNRGIDGNLAWAEENRSEGNLSNALPLLYRQLRSYGPQRGRLVLPCFSALAQIHFERATTNGDS